MPSSRSFHFAFAAVLGLGCAQGEELGPPFIPRDDASESSTEEEVGVDTALPPEAEASLESSPEVPVPVDVLVESVSDVAAEEAAPVEAGPCTVCDQAGCGSCPTVTTIALGGGQRIDSIEVTNAQYAAWLATQPKTSNQISACAANASFVPAADWPVTNQDDFPVSNVDWCDAYAYCAWAKKRLCGKIGGGENAFADFQDANASQWFKACTGGGVKTYPYGNDYQATACNGADYGKGVKLGAGQASGCMGAYPGLFDLSGNVWEWEDSCDATHQCRIRGGSYTNPSNALKCATDSSLPRTTTDPSIGFRCCSE